MPFVTKMTSIDIKFFCKNKNSGIHTIIYNSQKINNKLYTRKPIPQYFFKLLFILYKKETINHSKKHEVKFKKKVIKQ